MVTANCHLLKNSEDEGFFFFLSEMKHCGFSPYLLSSEPKTILLLLEAQVSFNTSNSAFMLNTVGLRFYCANVGTYN